MMRFTKKVIHDHFFQLFSSINNGEKKQWRMWSYLAILLVTKLYPLIVGGHVFTHSLTGPQ